MVAVRKHRKCPCNYFGVEGASRRCRQNQNNVA